MTIAPVRPALMTLVRLLLGLRSAYLIQLIVVGFAGSAYYYKLHLRDFSGSKVGNLTRVINLVLPPYNRGLF